MVAESSPLPPDDSPMQVFRDTAGRGRLTIEFYNGVEIAQVFNVDGQAVASLDFQNPQRPVVFLLAADGSLVSSAQLMNPVASLPQAQSRKGT